MCQTAYPSMPTRSCPMMTKLTERETEKLVFNLAVALLHDSISEEGKSQLVALLQSSAQARRSYAECMYESALLSQMCCDGADYSGVSGN